MSAETARR